MISAMDPLPPEDRIAHAAPEVQPIRVGLTASANASVAVEIGRRIVQGVYPAGSVLPNEADWAVMFGVSRTVVRESIKILMAKNLLTSRPKIGSRVEPRERWNLLDRDVLLWYSQSPDRAGFLKSLQELRQIIEPHLAALAAERRSEAQMQAISAACHDMGTAPTLAQRTLADTRFHMSILRAAGNELLMPLASMIDAALEQLFTYVTREANDLRHAQGLHEDVEKAIRLQRPEAARRAVLKLLNNTNAVIRKSQQGPSGA